MWCLFSHLGDYSWVPEHFEIFFHSKFATKIHPHCSSFFHFSPLDLISKNKQINNFAKNFDHLCIWYILHCHLNLVVFLNDISKSVFNVHLLWLVTYAQVSLRIFFIVHCHSNDNLVRYKILSSKFFPQYLKHIIPLCFCLWCCYSEIWYQSDSCSFVVIHFFLFRIKIVFDILKISYSVSRGEIFHLSPICTLSIYVRLIIF